MHYEPTPEEKAAQKAQDEYYARKERENRKAFGKCRAVTASDVRHQAAALTKRRKAAKAKKAQRKSQRRAA